MLSKQFLEFDKVTSLRFCGRCVVTTPSSANALTALRCCELGEQFEFRLVQNGDGRVTFAF